ncbi:MAG TPA: thioredoxin [Armatimonadetes bacterium]|nr:thioredoxin [Armatimonadota bacterium]
MSAVLHLTEEDFDEEILQSDAPAMVDFWAPWCGPCHALAPIVERLAERYQGQVKIAKVNVDEAQQLAIRYSIMSIPTLLFFKDGEVVDRIIGVTRESQIEAKLKELIGAE